MRKHTKRGFLASVSAMVTTVALALGGAAAAHANTEENRVPESSWVTITKLEQPESLGNRATGQELDSLEGYTGVGGVIFDYYLIPETQAGGNNDIGTNVGQEYAAGLTPDSDDVTAVTNPVDAVPTGSFDPTLTPSGVTSTELDRGLYLVQERPESVPAGVTASAPFLLSVPLTHPENLNAWLEHIYVYPKNSVIEGEKTVINSGADQITVGSDVTWTINADIPRVENPDYDSTGTGQFIATDLFRIDDTLQADELELSGGFQEGNNESIVVSAGGTALVEGEDYNITQIDDGDAYTYQILFTETGRQALASAVNETPTAQVTVELTTTVLQAAEITNSANVYPNSDSVTQNSPLELPGTDVRYGSVNFSKVSSDETITDLSGAVFQLYSTREAAEELTESLRVAPTDNAGVVQNQWSPSSADGSFSIEGLRYSGYADGETFEDGAEDPRYQTYWLVETTAPDGHQLLAEPLEIIITGDADGDGREITNSANTGGFELPLTGGAGTLWLTIAGIALLAAVVLVARRRRAAANAE